MVPMSTETQLGASARITEVVTAWPGVEAGFGRRGEWSFKVGGKEIGHLHGDHAAHLMLPKETFDELLAAGRVGPHPVFPDRRGPAARPITDDADVDDVIALMRMNYERITGRRDG